MNKKARHKLRVSGASLEERYIIKKFKTASSKEIGRVFSEIEKRRFGIVRAVFFGRPNELKKIAKTASSYPCMLLGHSNKTKKAVETCGIEILAVKGKFDSFEYIKSDKKTIGAFFKIRSREYLYVSGLGLEERVGKIGLKEEAKKIYASVDGILSRYKFSPRNIYRFWNCMENMLENNAENYALFNEARDEYFKKHGVSDYPAATGIEAALPGRQRISISLEAIKAKKKNDISFETLHSDFQCEAWEYKKHKAWKYGPKFSRAKLLKFERERMKKIYVSGTSNVDQKGRSILLDDYEKNISYVISCVEHLLKKAGASLDDVAASRVYFKNDELSETFQKIYRDRKWAFPYNSLFANICRENFFFEMECIAVKNAKPDDAKPAK